MQTKNYFEIFSTYACCPCGDMDLHGNGNEGDFLLASRDWVGIATVYTHRIWYVVDVKRLVMATTNLGQQIASAK